MTQAHVVNAHLPNVLKFTFVFHTPVPLLPSWASTRSSSGMPTTSVVSLRLREGANPSGRARSQWR